MPRRRHIARTRVPPHPFVPAPELADRYVPVERRWTGAGPLRWCDRCGLPGEPGDHRHPVPDEELLTDAAELDRRILGERELAAAA